MKENFRSTVDVFATAVVSGSCLTAIMYYWKSNRVAAMAYVVAFFWMAVSLVLTYIVRERREERQQHEHIIELLEEQLKIQRRKFTELQRDTITGRHLDV